MSFFEGSEKKLEVVIDSSQLIEGSLRNLGRGFWSKVVEASQALILSEIQSENCVAYLLSESSLFVWDDKFTMITCGQTTLAKAFLEFQNTVSSAKIISAIYERKNEYAPEKQFSSFSEDVSLLNEVFNGEGVSFEFGSKQDHFIELYNYQHKFIPAPEDTTLEILMYEIGHRALKVFNQEGHTATGIRSFLNFEEHFPEFAVDDYVFSPTGYSLNALNGSKYITIHVTPESQSSYVSFETNIFNGDGNIELVQQVVSIFEPSSYDVFDFRQDSHKANQGQKSCVNDFLTNGFQIKASEFQQLQCGYHLEYAHYHKDQ
ncbi:MAG: adenosylmethionine decarboxylase [Bdellovibrionaceae bacterium]|jgi:S-adenosylmethionine decarboxylase|nr:adenosylmethionine decarboxylase [Pseudobdellovibrionaceae bacterium]